jgi:cytochrome c oxidase cbb3-type subunit 2
MLSAGAGIIVVVALVAITSGSSRTQAGIAPGAERAAEGVKAAQVVRNGLGELKWAVAPLTGLTPEQEAGRQVFESSGCAYCHSRVPGVEAEASHAGLAAIAAGQGYAARRGFGPNLSRVGLKYGDDWHRAHFWNPRYTVPDSAMPRFMELFDGPHGPVAIVDDAQGRRTLERTAQSERLFDFEAEEVILLTPNGDGLAFVREAGRYPVIHTPNDEYPGDEVTLVAGTERLDNLIAYLQTLGLERGKWRELQVEHQLQFQEASLPSSDRLVRAGERIYRENCIGCHGESGDGNGPAAAFMEVRPRNFQYALFKFRVTPTGSLPTDGDLMRTVTRGVRGTAMPSFHGTLSRSERLAVIQYIKRELAVDRMDPSYPYAYFEEEAPEPPISLWLEPEASSMVVERGAEIWQQAKCWECHGDAGRGDGEKADGLEDDFGYPIRPANLTTGLFKSGVAVRDIYRTITTGLNGTPMPSYQASFDDADRWALAYYVASLSAFKDPLSGDPLPFSEADRAALNDPEVDTQQAAVAYETMVDRCRTRRSAGLPAPGPCGK